MSRTISEYCIKHGHQEFFEADDPWNYGPLLHCPECYPDHPDPKVEEKNEQECNKICAY